MKDHPIRENEKLLHSLSAQLERDPLADLQRAYLAYSETREAAEDSRRASDGREAFWGEVEMRDRAAVIGQYEAIRQELVKQERVAKQPLRSPNSEVYKAPDILHRVAVARRLVERSRVLKGQISKCGDDTVKADLEKRFARVSSELRAKTKDIRHAARGPAAESIIKECGRENLQILRAEKLVPQLRMAELSGRRMARELRMHAKLQVTKESMHHDDPFLRATIVQSHQRTMPQVRPGISDTEDDLLRAAVALDRSAQILAAQKDLDYGMRLGEEHKGPHRDFAEAHKALRERSRLLDSEQARYRKLRDSKPELPEQLVKSHPQVVAAVSAASRATENLKSLGVKISQLERSFLSRMIHREELRLLRFNVSRHESTLGAANASIRRHVNDPSLLKECERSAAQAIGKKAEAVEVLKRNRPLYAANQELKRVLKSTEHIASYSRSISRSHVQMMSIGSP